MLGESVATILLAIALFGFLALCWLTWSQLQVESVSALLKVNVDDIWPMLWLILLFLGANVIAYLACAFRSMLKKLK
ncbi:hypothetical protein [Motilimonas pumila]|uniref:Uncharacterized protein n=1 Tax=Motilimonas pumila TaxID=2303987 RepID=A0A418YBQ3_9GAMM|nr:hypothetical protein [Motilimonas pumila]RJG41937.1 hypothetical protein D1Z90_15715 [Motilimonas pumila]